MDNERVKALQRWRAFFIEKFTKKTKQIRNFAYA